MCRVLSACIAVWLCLTSAPVSAQAIDPSTAHLTLHQPFALDLLVRGDALTASRSKHCLSGDFQSGNHHLPADEIQLSLAPSERPGWYRARFQHAHVVEDSSLVARIVVRCPALYERELVLQAQPAPAQDLRGKALSERDPTSSPKASSLVVAPPFSPAAHAVREAGLPHKALVRAKPSPPGTPPEQGNPNTANRQQYAHDVEALQQELARTRTELTRLRHQTLVTPPLTTIPQPLIEWTQAAWASLAIPLIWLIPWLKRRRATAAKRIHTMDIALPKAQTTIPHGPSIHTALTPATPGVLHSHTTAPKPPVDLPRERATLNHDLFPATAVPPGAASLEDREAAVFTCQVDKLVSDGYIRVAVDLLEKSLQAGVAKNPWLLLQLLSLHQRLGHLSESAQTISLLQTLYRVHLPTMGGQTMEGRDLLAHPEVLNEISLVWHSPQASALLEGLVFRSPGPSWDLATFHDLLLLHAIAQNRVTDTPAPEASADIRPFEPMLEWSVDD